MVHVDLRVSDTRIKDRAAGEAIGLKVILLSVAAVTAGIWACLLLVLTWALGFKIAAIWLAAIVISIFLATLFMLSLIVVGTE
ncbi:MAG: hypothetical protein HC850_04935 [Rhodomicrobium sp.]|nr:hypothetical protein [Rhodomicrobium sp.]